VTISENSVTAVYDFWFMLAPIFKLSSVKYNSVFSKDQPALNKLPENIKLDWNLPWNFNWRFFWHPSFGAKSSLHFLGWVIVILCL